MRTTIDLPDELFRQVKAQAALDGRKLREVIAGYVEQGLNRGPDPDFRELRRRTPLPGIPVTGNRLPALSNEELARIEDEEERAGSAIAA